MINSYFHDSRIYEIYIQMQLVQQGQTYCQIEPEKS